MAHLTREELLKSGVVSPDYQQVFRSPYDALRAFDDRPVDLDAPDFFAHREARAAHLQKLRHLYPMPGPIPEHVIESMHQVPTRDGSFVPVRVYQPIKGPPEGGSPLIMMYHEGGWSMGDLSDEDLNCRMFARDLGAVCVNVEYRLAPEHKFPIGINDSWDALKWAVTNNDKLKATPSRGLIVGGASAGGNIAAVMSLLSRDEALDPPITGQYLCVPALLSEANVPAHLSHLYESRSKNVHDPVLKGLLPGMIEEIYGCDTKSPLWDPYIHPKGHRGVAKAFFQVGGLDPLRDEAVLYDRALRESGVLTRFELYHGFGHMFWTNYPEVKESEKFVRDTLAGIRWLLEQ